MTLAHATMKDHRLAPRYAAGDAVLIDFSAEPVIGQWGFVTLAASKAPGRVGFLGIVRKRTRRGVRLEVYRALAAGASVIRFFSWGEVARIGWARGNFTDEHLTGYCRLMAMQAARAAA